MKGDEERAPRQVDLTAKYHARLDSLNDAIRTCHVTRRSQSESIILEYLELHSFTMLAKL